MISVLKRVKEDTKVMQREMEDTEKAQTSLT
jgi:hypothetical protein